MLLNLFAIDRILVVRDSKETAKLLLGIVDQDRKQDLTLVGCDDWFVVGDHFRKQRDEKQCEEKPEAPVAATVGLEVLPASATDRGDTQDRRWPAIPRDSLDSVEA